MLIALLTLLTGIVVTQSCVAGRLLEWRSIGPFIAPAAAAFLVARFFAFDDYYLPTLRRMSDGGWVAGWWIVALVVLALVAAVVAKIQPRAGVAMTSFVLFVIAVTAAAESMGH